MDNVQAYKELTLYRVVITFHFMIDVDGELKILSELFQTTNLCVSDVITGIERALDQLSIMRTTDGASLQLRISKTRSIVTRKFIMV